MMVLESHERLGGLWYVKFVFFLLTLL